jgi:hypothetical protein
MNEDKLLTLYRAAQALGMTQRELRNNARLGLVPALRLKDENGEEYFRFSIPMIREAMERNGGSLPKLESPLAKYRAGRMGYVQV